VAIEHIYLPNEVFADFKLNIHNSSQTAFAYSYLYYVTYLYRYCKFIDDNGEKVTQESIKQFLGYSPKNKRVDYIIKKGGLLDILGYTVTTTDYPIQFLYDSLDFIYFETISNYKGIIKKKNDKGEVIPLNERNFKIKKPLKAFFRTEEFLFHKELTGTFYQVEDTHRIDYKTFEYIIKHRQLGTLAFYLYGFLKHKNDIFKSGYQRSAEKIGDEIGISERTVRKYVNLLEEHHLINVERKQFNLHLEEADFEANIYNII
jgi:hypothetical protein